MAIDRRNDGSRNASPLSHRCALFRRVLEVCQQVELDRSYVRLRFRGVKCQLPLTSDRLFEISVAGSGG
jgi:hypothetical protein